ncbi:MAG: FAD-binding protein [Candidatus Heimdallarchaeota archaeon]
MKFSQHKSYVASISNQMEEFFRLKKKVRIYHGSTNSTRAQNFKEGEIIDVSHLNRVIHINDKEQFALVEPNVPMDKLVDETLHHQLIPPVVMEFPGITVGGGIQGGAGESSSFRWGGFHEICEEYEIILGNGAVISASPEQNSDLFYGTACSYGSLGIISLAKMKLIPAKKFVHLRYHRVRSFQEAIDLIDRISKENIGYLDGIMFKRDLGVVMVGDLTNYSSLPVKTFRKARDEWFYLHAQKVAKNHDEWEELIPIRDYLFRYDRGAFWVGQYPFRGRLPFNRITRAIFNPLLNTRTMYGILHASEVSKNFVIQDISLPKETVRQFMDWVDKKLHIYPLWICPLKPGKNDRLSPAYIETDLVVNIGVWGKIPVNADFLKANRRLEETARKLGGRKVLYAHTYYSKEDFWEIYDSDWYERLRSSYNADLVFPDIYSKVRVSGKQSPAAPRKGIFHFLKFSTKLPIAKKSKAI